MPESFSLPKEFVFDGLRLEPLTPKHAEKDYAAVMSHLDEIAGVFAPGYPWPRKSLTLEEDFSDLEWHENEFRQKTSFAYTVLSADCSECLGCIYVYPPTARGFDAEVFFWAAGERGGGLDARLAVVVSAFLKSWPFARIAFPGRALSWQEWRALGGRTYGTEKS
ncbi:hypothetical protein AUJ14_02535 [Candidatus Micrarchaeota archaeon CG1_02_55_22]|nr:MAG: hypothetical protein AUJ14_02535 [Candidatus Micrarchaeota archaeon CG1_02_55_22]